ncbi:integration host factor subunit beta [Gilliamella sp. Fer1-1]|uniref:integration host factor subunit beta n=2 Tax=Gilliamella TaxID=1193503 RepID=UPI00080E9D65|nr:integration host factor subunit beta [Gilliamella apicola]OCG18418.1 integration host factor subunit beta [Gilliamella apicola]OCG24476.1 integration host factor subunit beta [Gilliamella apicola]OCG27478.1 integration host factor subunit beta [Gilliamella apicola]OCG37371.1 integration host factor subunit beta [Gilliamella apicola]OCG41400.1 integration host factor subunit beta [Gilliamella apicola]
MNRSDLVERIVNWRTHLPVQLVDDSVRDIIEQIALAMEGNDRVEIRGFGSFSLNYRAPRKARNPRTGGNVEVKHKYIPHFKPGKELRERVNNAAKA